MGDYFAVHVPSSAPDDDEWKDGAVFTTLKETSKFVNSPELKVKGVRFKKFSSPDDAREFAKIGFGFDDKTESPNQSFIAEPSVSFPSVSRIQFNRLKQAIEKSNNEEFDGLINSNPRYLINVGSDTPTIVVEGFRYNALHIAARVGNAYVVKRVLNLVLDHTVLGAVYGTSKEDLQMRSNILLKSYLNMPDKGANDTPLHFASKFGHKHIVEILLKFKLCEKNSLNKQNLTPAAICCTRYSYSDKNQVMSEIQLLLRSLYVPIYRQTIDYYCTVIKRPCDFEELVPLLEIRDHVNSKPSLEYSVLSAYAGPFSDPQMAKNFYDEWTKSERKYRLMNPKKGSERVGRLIACKFGVRWMEYWEFSKELVDLRSDAGLNKLNKYLIKTRLDQEKSARNEEEMVVDTDNSSINMDDKKTTVEDVADWNSLDEITDRLFTLHLDEQSGDECSSIVRNGDSYTDAIDEDQFTTPPTSPKPIFVHNGVPSKEDDELLCALALVDSIMLSRYGAINEYVHQLEKVEEEERSKWPSTDSPRVRKTKLSK